MKGLLIKDFSLLKNQKNFFVLVFVMAGFLTIANGAESSPATFVLPYVGFVSSFFVLSTISYDEYDNGNAFLFTLPFERKVYVVEKYVFGILTGVAGMLIILAFVLVYMNMNVRYAEAEETLLVAGVSAGLLFFFLSVMIPFQLKFGPEKGRIAMIIVFLGIFAAVYGLAKVVNVGNMDLSGLIQTADAMGPAGVALVFLAVSLLVLAASMTISIRIMEKKEF